MSRHYYRARALALSDSLPETTGRLEMAERNYAAVRVTVEREDGSLPPGSIATAGVGWTDAYGRAVVAVAAAEEMDGPLTPEITAELDRLITKVEEAGTAFARTIQSRQSGVPVRAGFGGGSLFVGALLLAGVWLASRQQDPWA